jgi:cytochrome c oxidase subunit IV
MSKSLKLVIAFILFVLGFLSLLMSMLGLQFTYLRWLENLPVLVSVLIKLTMLIGGIVLAYMTTLGNEQEE